MLPFKGFCCHQKNVAINDNWMWQKLVPAHFVNPALLCAAESMTR